VSIRWSAATDVDLLKTALEACGYTVRENGSVLSFSHAGRNNTFDKTRKTMVVTQGVDVAEIKRQYSEQVVESQARQFGWKLTWQTNAAGNREAAVQRRAF
jgi:hypothetical protein